MLEVHAFLCVWKHNLYFSIEQSLGSMARFQMVIHLELWGALGCSFYYTF